jgi:hypothetical protein
VSELTALCYHVGNVHFLYSEVSRNFGNKEFQARVDRLHKAVRGKAVAALARGFVVVCVNLALFREAYSNIRAFQERPPEAFVKDSPTSLANLAQ